jgi:HEAT repeat protein
MVAGRLVEDGVKMIQTYAMKRCCAFIITALILASPSYPLDDATLRACLRDLSSENWKVRQNACKTLGEAQINDAAAIQALAQRLYDADTLVRHEAAKSLGEMHRNADRAIADLIRVLDQDYVGAAASRALVKIGSNSVRPLTEVAANPTEKEDLRIAALKVLAEFGHDAKSAAKDLAPLLRNSKQSYEMINSICYALGAIGSEARDAAPDLLVLCNHPDSKVRLEAARTLGKIGPLGTNQIRAFIETMQKEQETWVQVSKGQIDSRRQPLSNVNQARDECMIIDDEHRCARVMIEMVRSLEKLQAQMAFEDARAIVLPCLVRLLEYPHSSLLHKHFHPQNCYCPHCHLYICLAKALRYYGPDAKSALPKLNDLLQHEFPRNELQQTIDIIQRNQSRNPQARVLKTVDGRAVTELVVQGNE